MNTFGRDILVTVLIAALAFFALHASIQSFVLGDNRNNSNDSHNGWTIPRQSIIGKAGCASGRRTDGD